MKEFIKELARKMGYEIRGFPLPEHDYANPFYVQKFLFKGLIEKPIIFDVGAANGETVVRYENVFPQSEIYSFEPFKEHFGNLCKNHKNIHAYNTALGNKNGVISFHINTNSGASSILPMNKEIYTYYGTKMEDKELIEVPIITLDKFVKDNSIDHIDILKMDTQGTEYDILEGATETLKKTKLIFTEIILIPTYENQKEFDEILKLLRLNGFYLHNFYDLVCGKGKVPSRIKQLDIIFLNEKFFPR